MSAGGGREARGRDRLQRRSSPEAAKSEKRFSGVKNRIEHPGRPGPQSRGGYFIGAGMFKIFSTMTQEVVWH